MRKEIVLEALKKGIIYVLPFIRKKSLQLKTRLVNFVKSSVNHQSPFQSPCKLSSLFRQKDSPRRRSALTLFTDTRVVTARLLIMVKHTATFLLELQSISVYLIQLKSVLKVRNNRQYLIANLNLTVQQALIILIFQPLTQTNSDFLSRKVY